MEFRPLIDRLSSVVKDRPKKNGVVRRYRFPSLLISLIYIVGIFNVRDADGRDFNSIEQVKAAFVLNIARFVTWPADSPLQQSERLLLCLYRSNPLQQAIATIEGEKIGGRIIEVRQIKNLEASDSCSILLISSSELQTFTSELPPNFNRPMLTITDLTEAPLSVESRRGVLIALIRNGTRIGFEVDLEQVRQAGFRMSSELLKLANIVGGSD